MDSKESPNTRRDFLKLGTLGALAACGSACSCSSGASHEHKEVGKKVRLLSPDGEMVEIDESHLRHANHSVVSREEARIGIPGKKFVMVIDLAKCKNARKCVSACQKMHHIPEDKEWLSIKLMKDSEAGSPYWFPKTCFHCDNPPCVKVCPVDATFKRSDGLVLIDNERCIGCKFCMAACPYSTRVFNWDEPEVSPTVAALSYSPETSVPSKVGTVEKCDFCPDMVREGKLPDCVTACPNGVFYFGDENEDVVSNGDETIRFSQIIAERGGYRYAEDLGTKPRVYYLPPRDRIFPVERGLDGKSDELKERYKDILNPEK
ncbi:MAG: 4Fe-4S dicluster domain-containing protein [Cyclobacteriaceae bacterium]|nr:4Fe-4S dicluster domain-containing protein [Cyclobacteriaceae bacterium]